MAVEGTGNDLMTFDSRQASIDRKLLQIISEGFDLASSDLRLTTLLQDLTNPSSASQQSQFHASSSNQINRSVEINKLFIRTRQLLLSKEHNDVRTGLQLVNELIRASPWQVIVSQCSEWINNALLNFKHCPKESINVLDALLGLHVRQKAEFWRNVGSGASTKYGLILMEYAESVSMEKENKEDLSIVLNALNNQVSLHPTSFRSHAPRIQKFCFSFIFQSQTSIPESVRLLARLPLTGKGMEDQKNLWSITLTLFLRETRLAWELCSNAFLPSSSSHSTSSMFSNDTDQTDNLALLRVGHSRLALLLGSLPNPGILAIFLAEASGNAVEMPTEEILGIAHSILSLQPLSPTRLEHQPEIGLHAAQAALLPRAHICAITFLASLQPCIWQRGYGETVQRLINLAEKGSSTVRCAALKALSIMPITFDPHGTLLSRCTRTCLAQLTKLVSQTDGSFAEGKDAITTSINGSNSRANKKRRTYEADQVLFKPLNGLVDLDDDEKEACTAAARILASRLFEYLVTFVSPQLHDLAQSTCVLMLGVTELTMKSDHQGKQSGGYCGGYLLESLLASLAKLISLSRGAILSVLSVRSAAICSQTILHPDWKIRSASEQLKIALCDTFHPKLPPKLSLRLHIEQDRTDLMTSTNENGEERQLDEVVLDEDMGRSEMEIIRDVLDIEKPSSIIQFPRLSAPDNLPTAVPPPSSTTNKNTLSPDPVKPIRRTSIPRIGSPNVNHARMESQSPQRSPTTMRNEFITAREEEGTNTNLLSSPFAKSKKAVSDAKPSEDLSHAKEKKEEIVAQPSSSEAYKPILSNNKGQDENEYDSDDSMPTLDVRSSDEEDN